MEVQMRWRFAVLCGLALAALGCGDAAAPKFPNVAGSYQVSGTFNDFAANLASLGGTITLVQPSRDDAALSGTANVTVVLAGETLVLTQLTNASISESGAVSFQLGPVATGSTWAFSGVLSGTTITGTHTLTSATGETFAGAFTAVKLAQ